MTRLLLLAFALLMGMLVFERVSRSRSADTTHPSAAPKNIAAASGSRIAAPVPVAAQAEGTPAMDLLARLEGRRRLARAGSSTYFDSLFTETDSVVRRWPDNLGLRFVLAVPPGDSAANDALVLEVVRRASAVWEDAELGLHFTLVSDTSGAQIVARSTAQLGADRAGQTDLQWTLDGAIHSAVITLALRDEAGKSISQAAALAVAVHEIGHALGLAHSPQTEDVMYPATRTAVLSRRDRATFTLLYELPLGTIREVVK